MVRDGMHIGRIVRPPAYGATLRGVDDAAAGAIAGVTVVRDGTLVSVVAPNERVAARAVAALRVEWK